MLDMAHKPKVLRVDGSMRHTGSSTRDLADKVIEALAPSHVVTRDLAHGIELVDEAWIGANFTAAPERDAAARVRLAGSDALVDELEDADVLVLSAPIYNFHVPAAVKAWIDQIARVGRTFRYTEEGPVGLLEGKRAIVVVASGGTQLGTEIDFISDYLRFVLGFVGITDVRFVDGSAGQDVGDVAALVAA